MPGSFSVQRAEIDRINSGSELVPTKRELSGARLANCSADSPSAVEAHRCRLRHQDVDHVDVNFQFHRPLCSSTQTILYEFN